MRLLLLLFLGFAWPAFARDFETQIEEPPTQLGDCGLFRLWLNPGSHPNRILVAIWGSNQSSLAIVDDPAWQKLAESIDCALMAGFFFPQSSNNRWDHAEEGSGEALVKALQRLALISGENQLEEGRLYVVGASQGGQFALNFAAWNPKRTAGFVSLKGGRHDVSAVQKAAGVPGLFVAGQMDAPFRMANITAVFARGHALSAPWCLAIEPQGGHSPDSCGPLVRSYLQGLWGAQSRDEGKNKSASDKLEINPSTGCGWFPDAQFKRDWSAFESGAFAPSLPPLNFKSVTPPFLPGICTPPSEDLGIIRSGRRSERFMLAVTPTGSALWDELRVLESPYLSDEKVVKISPNHFEVSASLETSDLPLGRFAGALPLRFKSQGNPILGALNVPLRATIIGDVAAIPSLILLKSGPNGIESAHIEIIGKKNEPVTLFSYQAVPGVRVESSTIANHLELTVSFNGFKTSPSGLDSGSLLLHLKTDKEWVLRVPYISSSR